MNTRFGRAFRYEIGNYIRAIGVLWLVMALIPPVMMALAYFLAGGRRHHQLQRLLPVAVGVFGLVLGMVSLRENPAGAEPERRLPAVRLSCRTWRHWRWRRCWWPWAPQ